MDLPFPEEQIGLPGFSHVSKESKKLWIFTWFILGAAFVTYIAFLGAQASNEGKTPATRLVISPNKFEHLPAITVCPLTKGETIEFPNPADNDNVEGACTAFKQPNGNEDEDTEVVKCTAILAPGTNCAVINPTGNITVLPRTDYVDVVLRVQVVSGASLRGVEFLLSRYQDPNNVKAAELTSVDRFSAPFSARTHVRWRRTAWKTLKGQTSYTYGISASSVPLTTGDAARDSRTVILRMAAGRAHDELIEEYRPTTALVFIAAAGATWGYIVVVIAIFFVPFYGRDGQRWVKFRFMSSRMDPVPLAPGLDDGQPSGPGGAWAHHRKAKELNTHVITTESSSTYPYESDTS